MIIINMNCSFELNREDVEEVSELLSVERYCFTSLIVSQGTNSSFNYSSDLTDSSVYTKHSSVIYTVYMFTLYILLYYKLYV